MAKGSDNAPTAKNNVPVGFRWRREVRDALQLAASAQRPETSGSRLSQHIIEQWLRANKDDKGRPFLRGKA